MNEENRLMKSPSIVFSVNSLDNWGRSTIEGYGYLDIPSTPDSYELEIPCWGPKIT